MYSDDLIRRIKELNKIEDVVREFGIELKSNKALCPFHQEKHPSFSVEPRRQIARCFSCMGKPVDVIGFVMKMMNCGFSDAMRHLAKRSGIEIEPLTPEQEAVVQKSIRKKEILRIAADFYHEQLVKNDYSDPGAYIKEKDFTKQILDDFVVGLASGNGLMEALSKNGVKAEEGIEVGILFVRERDGRVFEFFQNRLTFPLIVDEEVVGMTGRTVIKDGEHKWLHLKGEISNLYNENALKTASEVLVCEGASDTLTAIMRGYEAVGVLGAGSFKPEFYQKFKGIRQVYVCLDADDPGRSGAEQISKIFLGDEKIIDLPQDLDLSDYFKTHSQEEFERLKRDAKNYQERELDLEPAIPIHLMDTDEARYSDKKIQTEVMICAKGETFHVPKVFVARCDKACGINCPINKKPRRIHIPSDSKDLIDFTRFSDARIIARLRALAPCSEESRGRIHIKIVERVTVQEILVIPRVSKIEATVRDGTEVDVDDLGREYRDKKIFALTSLPKTNQYFRGYGWVKSSPKSQVATVLLYKLEPISNDYENFQITDDLKDRFKRFQVTDGYTIESKLNELLHDVTIHITEIYGEHRERALLCMLLAYHSQIKFKFDNEPLNRGWVELAIVGDSGQGKTQLFDRLSKSIGLGEFISGVSATRTGISYSYQQTGDTWFLKWGKYPLNDGRLLFIDEGQALSIDEWERMSSGRSDGVIRADGIKQGEHPTRTRLIVSCNPKDNRIIDDNMCGVETLKYIFRAADIRRFDLAIFLSSSDQSVDVVNKPKEMRISAPQIIPSNLLRGSICWAWTRKARDIIFEEAARKRVYEVAQELTLLYDSAKDIPLVTTDIRHKIARLAVALAKFVHSTDMDHQKVIVKKEHVDYVNTLIRQVLDHENCGLNFYADLRKEHSTLTDREYEEIIATMIVAKFAYKTGPTFMLAEDTRLIFLDFANNDVVERSQLAESLDIEEDSVTRKLKILKNFKLIRGRSGKRGYRKTPKFNKLLRRLLIDGRLQRH